MLSSQHRQEARRAYGKWSVAINEHLSQPDGIIFPSRLNGETNLAVYDRTVPKLRSGGARKLVAVTDIIDVLDSYKVALRVRPWAGPEEPAWLRGPSPAP